MQLFSKKLLASLAVAAALGAAGLYAQTTKGQGLHRFKAMTSALNLTPEQQAQAKSIFQDARQSAKPLRQQLRETRKSLQAAIQSGNADQIQQFANTQGTEMGQLAAIRATAMSKMYQTLTPDQQQKLLAFRQSHARPKGAVQN
jgi:Spy/CpxP family protein refolding chaperone